MCLRGVGTSHLQSPSSSTAGAFRHLHLLIIVLALAVMAVAISSARGQRTDGGFVDAMYGPNDRSRFATIRALGEFGTYAIDGIVGYPPWDTQDYVRRPDDGHLYSEKPTLLPTLLAAEYWLLRHIPTLAVVDGSWQHTGHLTFDEQLLAVVRIIVATANLLPMALLLILFARLLPTLGVGAWAQAVALATLGFGTYLTGYVVVLNNHISAAAAAFTAFYLTLRIIRDGKREDWRFALAGLGAGLAFAFELPAAALLGLLGLLLLIAAPRQTLLGFVPAALVPIAAHFITTWRVTGNLTPAYGMTHWYDFPGSYWKVHPETGRLTGVQLDAGSGIYVFDHAANIDAQWESWYVYLFHMLFGHHGIVVLTPILLIACVGMWRVARDRGPLSTFAWMTMLLTAILVAFYTFGPHFGIGQRNYGGVSNGLRWLFWLLPLWLTFLPHGLQWRAHRIGFRVLALVLLCISSGSALYAMRDPWTRSWLHEGMRIAGLVSY